MLRPAAVLAVGVVLVGLLAPGRLGAGTLLTYRENGQRMTVASEGDAVRIDFGADFSIFRSDGSIVQVDTAGHHFRISDLAARPHRRADPAVVPPTYALVARGETVAGYPADHWEVRRNGRPVMELWVASPAVLGMEAGDAAPFTALLERLAGLELVPPLDLLLAPGAPGGVPVRFDLMAPGSQNGIALVEVERRALGAAYFAPPAGFTQVLLPVEP
jgi:hypothetical protein